MIERGSRARFALEPPHALGIQPVAVGEQLDSYISPQPRVAGEINFAHAPGAQR
jgi:hypothetical protein